MADYPIICQRSSIGTYVRASDGVFIVVKDNEPRFETDGLLIESIQTNRITTYQFEGGGGSNEVTNYLVKGTSTPVLRVRQTAPSTSAERIVYNIDYTKACQAYSVFVRKEAGTKCMLEIYGDIAGTTVKSTPITFTTNNSTMSNLVFDSKIIKSVTSQKVKVPLREKTTGKETTLDFLRIKIIFKEPVRKDEQWNRMHIFAEARNSTGDDDDKSLVFGAQAESCPLVTSYIPTSGSIATRDRDYYQIKDLPTSDEFVYHFHWTGENTSKSRFEILTYENPVRRDKYKLVRVWQQTPESKTKYDQAVCWNTTYAKSSTNVSNSKLTVDLRGGWSKLQVFVNSTPLALVTDSSYTHGQLAIRGTIEIPGDDPESEGYIYHIKDFKIYNRALEQLDMDKIDTASPPSSPYFVAPLVSDLSATRIGSPWVSEFNGTNSYATFPVWDPSGSCDIEMEIYLSDVSKHNYILDSRTPTANDNGYMFYNHGSNTLTHNYGGTLTVNGYTNPVMDKPGLYRILITGITKTGPLVDRVGSRFNLTSHLDGKINYLLLRDNQYDVEDISGSGNKSRYYDFVEWTTAGSGPTTRNIRDTWNTGKNVGTLNNTKWVRKT